MEKGALHTMLLPGGKAPATKPPLLKVAMSYWKKTLHYTQELPYYAPNILLLGIPLYSGIVTSKSIMAWEGAGITTVGMFFTDGTLMTHDAFVRVYGVPNTLFLLHANISCYIRITWAQDGTEPLTHELLNMQYMMGKGNHMTKWLYRGIHTVAAVSFQTVREKWNIDIGHELTNKEWNNILEYPRKVSRNPKFKFIQLMIIHRAYLTPSRLNAMFPDVADNCPRCQLHNAKLFHMIWNCPKLQYYWNFSVHKLLHDDTPVRGDDSPEYCLLGLGPGGKRGGPIHKFNNLALFLAKRSITMR